MKKVNVKEAKAKVPMSKEKKRLIIILSAVGVALLAALIPIIIIVVGSMKPDPDEETPDIPEDVFEGTYIYELPAGISTYTFSENNKLTVVYSSPDGDVEVDEEENLIGGNVTKTDVYTYEVVSIDGKTHLRLTNVADNSVTTLPFVYGTMNPTYYFCENENCLWAESRGGTSQDPRVSGSEYCPSHADSKIYTKELSRRVIGLGEEMTLYYKLYDNQQ